MVKVTVALPTYNRASLLSNCISHVLLQTCKDFELLIIDDHSEDETAKLMEQLCKLDSRIRYYRNGARLGLQRSRNIAVASSKGDFVFFIEDDLILDPNCLENLLDTFNKLSFLDIKIGVVGPRLIEKFSNNRRKKVQYVTRINKHTGMIYSNFDVNANSAVEVPTLHSCCLISKSVFKKASGYDPKLYRGTSFREETDFYFRARKAGFKLYFEPRAVAIHRKATSGGCRMSSTKKMYFEMRNHTLFTFRFYGLKSFLMLPCYSFYVLSRFIYHTKRRYEIAMH